MSIPEPLNPKIPNARRFTPHTPFHHPHLDPNLCAEDLHLVPAALFSGRKLNSERRAATNLHVILKLTNEPNEIRKEFRDRIPQIDDVLGLWGELKGASPTMNGEAQLRARTRAADVQGWSSRGNGKGTIFNLVSDLDTPGQADMIYLTDATEDSGEHVEDSKIPPNLRTIEWLGFDGSYVHLEKSEAKMAASPKKEHFDFDEHDTRRNSTPPNLRLIQWLEDEEQYTSLSSETYRSEPDSDARASPDIGTYESFWINHDPSGPRLALRTDEGGSSSSTSR